MNKKGLSGDVILQIGLLTIAAFTTLLAANLFYDSVETAVYGDPYLAVRTMGSYAEFIDASPMPMTIYLEVPQDLMGNPGYGTVLYDPETCEFKVNKYPQNYMSSIILNHAWDTITLEEAVTIGALRKWRKAMSQKAYGASAALMAGSQYGGGGKLDELSNTQYNKNLQKSIKKQGYSLEQICSASASCKNVDDLKAITKTKTGWKMVDNPNANKNLIAALAESDIPKNKINKIGTVAETGLKKDLGFVNSVKSRIVTRVGNAKTGLKNALTPSRAGRAVLRIGSGTRFVLSIPVKVIKFPGQAAGWVAEQAATQSKKLAAWAAKKIVNRLPAKLVKRVTEEGLEKVFCGPFPCGYVAALALSLGGYALEYIWTYLPINHFIDRSQDATNEINKEWASYSCKSKPDNVIVSKPNCKSEPYLIYPDFGSNWLEDNYLGVFSGFPELLEQSFAMPASQPTMETKSYDSIENAGNECIDAHNYLLSDEAAIDPGIANPFGLGENYPKATYLTTPFLGCFAITFAKPSWGTGCTLIYGVSYLSFWAAPATDHSATATASLLGGGLGYSMGGPAGAAIGTLVAGTAANNPIDSTRFLPTISKSAGMIDQDKYYYIEDPYLISLSKDVKDGEMVFEVNKEL